MHLVVYIVSLLSRILFIYRAPLPLLTVFEVPASIDNLAFLIFSEVISRDAEHSCFLAVHLTEITYLDSFLFGFSC